MTEIRSAGYEDLPSVLEIVRYYVENTAITFDYKTPDLAHFTKDYEEVIEKYPYLVAVDNNKILGYACAHPFKNKAAYDWSVETTIYVDKDHLHEGIGKKLYQALEMILKKQGVLNLNACISYLDHDDPYLTRNSVDYHAHLGYKLVAHFHQCGYKFNRWYDMVWMEKMIGNHLSPDPLLTFDEVKESFKEEVK